MDRRTFIQAGAAGSMALATRGIGAAETGAMRYDAAGKAAFLRAVDEYVSRVGAPAPPKRFVDTWESLAAYRAPAWYEDAKFGIFIHWGVYSVPGFMSEWYPRMMYQRGNPCYWHHLTKYGPPSKFGYKDFIPMFKAENFDAGAWAALFKQAGARYVVPVAEHHDGFAMYDCGFSEWTATKMGPKRDIVGELATAVRKEGLTFGLSSHRAEHWWFMDGGRKFKSDVRDPAFESFYGPAQPKDSPPDDAHLRDWLARSCELVDLYRPQVFWFDWWIEQPEFEPYRRKFAAYYYNRADEWGQEAVLNYKNQAFPDGAAVLDLERSGLTEIRPLVWQTDTSISYISWSYIKGDKFKEPGRLIADLVDIVSKNGVLLLNIGPKPDGTIPEPARDILLEIGRWLEMNGEAVYGTRPWKVFGEGPTQRERNKTYGLGEISAPRLTARDVRYTVKGDTLYAIVLGWPQDRKVTMTALGQNAGLAREPAAIRLLGSSAPVAFTRDDKALTVTLPPEPPGEHAVALEIKGAVKSA